MSAAPGLRTQDRPCADGLEQSALRLHRRAVPREAAFWLVGYVFDRRHPGHRPARPAVCHLPASVAFLLGCPHPDLRCLRGGRARHVAASRAGFGSGRAQAGAGGHPELQRGQHRRVHLRRQPGLALPGPDLVWGVGRPDDGRRHRGAQRDRPGLGLAAGVDGSHDRDQRRPAPWARSWLGCSPSTCRSRPCSSSRSSWSSSAPRRWPWPSYRRR